MSEVKKQRGLGRGLSSLLADSNITQPLEAQSRPKGVETLPIEFLVRNESQPRRHFDQEELQSLADSIGERGIIQPIVVQKVSDEKYMIIAGERRWRAAGMAKLHNVPVIVRDFSQQDIAEIALIENIQRADLTPIEEAAGYQSLIEKYGHTQDSLSKSIGKSRSHIANMLRLLKLDPEIRDMIERGEISTGHAKALASSQDPLHLAKEVFKTGMSVRELERLIDAGGASSSVRSEGSKGGGKKLEDADTRVLQEELKANLGMKVQIQHTDTGKGKMVINYKDLDQLDRLCQLLSR